MRAANRDNTDAFVLALLLQDEPFTKWYYIAELADDAGLTIQQAMGAAKHLHLEYGALSLMPASRAVRADEAGISRYEAVQRNYAEECLGEHERMQLARGRVFA